MNDVFLFPGLSSYKRELFAASSWC